MDSLSPIPTPASQRWRKRSRWITHSAFFLVICVLAAWLWRQMLKPAHFMGQVEVIQAIVATPDSGHLTNVWVSLHQEVKAGDIVAELITTDPRTVGSRMHLLRNRIHLLELEVDPTLMRQRASLEYERLAVEASRSKVDLALAEVGLARTANELTRNQELFNARIISEELFDFYAKSKEAAERHVQQLREVIDYNEKALERLTYLKEIAVPNDQNDPVRRALELEESRRQVFQDRLRPLELVAPIDGIVTAIHRRPNENVLAGEPIVTITAQRMERIIGYLPSNFPITPKVGMSVDVRTRAFERERALGKVLGFGPQLESVTNVFNRILVPPLGRPISVSVPPELDLAPGEPVDLRLIVE